MPLKKEYTLKPVKGHFFIKCLHAGFYDQAHQLECYSSERIWSLNDIANRMVHKSRNYGGFVITDLKDPVGYTIYRHDSRRNRLLILSMVIHPDYQRQGLGSLLVDKLKTKMDNRYQMKNRYLAWVVRESNLAGHMFLKSQGFKAVEVVKSHFVDHYPDITEDEDGYAFMYKGATRLL